jgi:D-sedoheptulose 7-phosphate isomerase
MEFKKYIDYVSQSLSLIKESEVELLIEKLFEARKENKTIFVIGNGGSAAFASHLCADLAKNTKTQNERFRILSLTDNVAFITAQGNDEGYDSIYEQQLATYAKEGDLLLAVSGSGNSPNIIKAVNWAKENKLNTFGILGYSGGKLKVLCDSNIHINLNDMGNVESLHVVILHYLIQRIGEIVYKN